jgi:hypothetical protein
MGVNKFYGFSSIAAAVCLVFFLAIPGMAQQPSQQGQEQPGATESQTQVSDAELKKAAGAYVEIMVINEQYQQSLQQAQNQDEMQQLQNSTNQKMVQAVENTGLDVDEYNKIMGQVMKNEQVAQRFNMQAQMKK